MSERDDFEEDEGYVTEAHVRRFKRIARNMAKLLEEIQETCPGANMYLEDQGNWHLLSGDSHDWNRNNNPARQDRIIECVRVPFSGGGAW